MRDRNNLWALLLLGLGACSAEPGRFELSLLWEMPPSDEVWLSARLEERTELTQPGRVLVTVPLQRYTPGAQLRFEDVPYGENRVVIVEGRALQDPAALPTHYGISELFELTAGQSVQVSVHINLVDRPGFTQEAPALEVLPTGIPPSGGAPLRVNTETVTVRVRIPADAEAPSVRLSNHPSFELSMPLPLSAPDCDERICTYQIINWSLSEGALPCEDRGVCPRQLFARLVDRFGYESLTTSLELVQDLETPIVLEEAGSVGAQLLPEPMNPLASTGALEAIAKGTVYRVSFGMSEPLAEAPQVDAVSARTDARLPLRMVSASGAFYTFELQLPAPLPDDVDGLYQLEVTGVDLAGNMGTTILSALPVPPLVDTTPPPAPDVRAPGRFVLHRSPWGSEQTEGLPRVLVEVAPGALSDGDWVFVRHPLLGEVGRAKLQAEGGTLTLAAPDSVDFELSVVDRAGNRSAQMRLEQGSWRATLNGRIAGQGSPNPHAVYLTNALALDLRERPSDAIEPSGDGFARLSRQDDQPVDKEALRGWAPLTLVDTNNTTRPEARYGARAAHDRLRQRVVLFGGQCALGLNCPLSTWEWDGLAWHKIETQETPPAAPSGMTYDRVLERTLLRASGAAVVIQRRAVDLAS